MLRIARYVVSLLLLSVLGCAQPETYHPRGDVSIAYLRSMADGRSTLVKDDLYIEGRVVLNDKLGESFKQFVVDDGSAGVVIEVDSDNIDVLVPLYSTVRVRCAGLYLGREGSRFTLGVRPTAEYVVDRIAEDELFNYVTVTTCDSAPPVPIVRSIADITAYDMLRYVCVEDLILVEDEQGATWCDEVGRDELYRSTQRHFTDGRDTLTVATINCCHYATEHIPTHRITLAGIVDSYDGEFVLRLSNHQTL